MYVEQQSFIENSTKQCLNEMLFILGLLSLCTWQKYMQQKFNKNIIYHYLVGID